MTDPNSPLYVVIISADTEWKVLRETYKQAAISTSVFGEYFKISIPVNEVARQVIFFHGGWGKIAAAASTQFICDKWKPDVLVNIGTCGGFDDSLHQGDILLANKTLVYDILEQMGSADEAIAAFTTELDTAWAADLLQDDIRQGLLVSADRDVVQSEIKKLQTTYQATAADWESGSIAWVAARNNTPVMILRGISDIVSETKAPAYGDIAHFEEGTRLCLEKLLTHLSPFLSAWETGHNQKK